MSTTLLGPTARPMVQLGGAHAWKQRSIRGIFCSFQWIDLRQHGFENTPDHAAVACMCLFRPGSVDRGSFVIPQPYAYLYGTREGHPTAHLFANGFIIAQEIGYDASDKHAYKALIDIIVEGIADLIQMPSEPPEGSDATLKQAILGIEASGKINGRTVHEELL